MSEKKRILIVFPIVYTEGIKDALEDRKNMIDEIEQRTGGLFKLDVATLEKGTASIEGSYDKPLIYLIYLRKLRRPNKKNTMPL